MLPRREERCQLTLGTAPMRQPGGGAPSAIPPIDIPGAPRDTAERSRPLPPRRPGPRSHAGKTPPTTTPPETHPMTTAIPAYNPRDDALLAAPPPLLLGALVPALLAALRWLDGVLGEAGGAVLRVGPWQATNSVTALLGLLVLSGAIIGLLAMVASAIVMRFPLWHHGWSASALVLALAFVGFLSRGNLSPGMLAVAAPLLLLGGGAWLWAWRRDALESSLFGLSATQAVTLVMLLGAASPPLLRPDLIALAIPLGLLDATLLFAAVAASPARRPLPLAAGALLNLLPLPLLDGTRIGALWVGPRGLIILAVVGLFATLAGVVWRLRAPQPTTAPRSPIAD